MAHESLTVASPTIDFAALDAMARRIRADVVRMSHRGRTPHLGSSLSCVDILVAAYWTAVRIDPQRPRDLDRDRLVFSKGHAAPALYATLAHRGFFPVEELSRYNEAGTALGEHPIAGVLPGVEAATGSLGHGLSLGAGMAWAARLQQRSCRVFVIVSDGECNEGSVWEAALLAPAKALGRLAVIVDYNKWQATGRSNQVMALSPLADKWRSFGWSACEVDGHDLRQLTAALGKVPDGSGNPVAIVAHTIKGKGVSFMEDDNNWHYLIPTAEQLRQAEAELASQ